MTDRIYKMVVRPMWGGGFFAYAPELCGCVADGETEDEAILSLQSAIAEWRDEAVRLGREVPEPGGLTH